MGWRHLRFSKSEESGLLVITVHCSKPTSLDAWCKHVVHGKHFEFDVAHPRTPGRLGGWPSRFAKNVTPYRTVPLDDGVLWNLVGTRAPPTFLQSSERRCACSAAQRCRIVGPILEPQLLATSLSAMYFGPSLSATHDSLLRCYEALPKLAANKTRSS